MDTTKEMAVIDRHFFSSPASTMKNIFVPLDLKADCQAVVEHATAIAQAFGSTLWLEHVAAPDPEFAGYEAGPQYIRDMRADELREEHHKLGRISKDCT